MHHSTSRDVCEGAGRQIGRSMLTSVPILKPILFCQIISSLVRKHICTPTLRDQDRQLPFPVWLCRRMMLEHVEHSNTLNKSKFGADACAKAAIVAGNQQLQLVLSDCF